MPSVEDRRSRKHASPDAGPQGMCITIATTGRRYVWIDLRYQNGDGIVNNETQKNSGRNAYRRSKCLPQQLQQLRHSHTCIVHHCLCFVNVLFQKPDPPPLQWVCSNPQQVIHVIMSIEVSDVEDILQTLM